MTAVTPRPVSDRVTPTNAFAVIAGGGTGGHVMPALAIGEALVAAGHARESIVFVGATSGMETELVPPHGFPLINQRVSNFPRRISLRHIASLARLGAAVVTGVRLLRRLRPRVVISVGGFASAPPVIAARIVRVPILNVAYDAVPGFATRVAARVARVSAVAFEACELPRRELTGAPIRAEIAALDRGGDRAGARAALGIAEDRFLLLVVGGSLGSGALNSVTDAFVDRHESSSDLAVRHVIGRRNDDGSRQSRDGRTGVLYQVVAFDDEIGRSLAAADLALTRAGATTVAELTAVGLPAIIVPWPGAAGAHQDANAASLGDRGAAIVIPETELSVDRLDREVARLRSHPSTLTEMAAASLALGHRDAAARIAVLAERLAQ